MSATREEIGQWFDQGVALRHSYMIVVTDMFSYESFPVYIAPFAETPVKEKVEKLRARSMTSVEEVYDLSMDRDAQLSESRAWHDGP